MIDYASLLNPEQHAAATAGDGPLLVLAAAGTGKTQTLVYRVAYLVEQGTPPDAILLLTFTNKAAREMLERARHVVGDAVGDVWSGTFHHVCNRLLRRYAPRIGYRHGFVIADRDDSHKLVADCMKELKLGGRDFPKKAILAGLFGQAANRGLPLDEFLESRLDQLAVDPADICRIHQLYQQRKFELGIMDFDDLLVNGVRLVEECPDIAARYRQQFRHILVDEFQDTNHLQTLLVDGLAGDHANVMAVGDDFQCIYSWRGADFRNIMEFPTRYPAARIIKLERNYRSTPEILAVANASIAGNPEQFQKKLRATRSAGVKPTALFLRDGSEQAAAVVRLVNRAHQQGRPLRDIAILYRAHYHSIELQMELTRSRIPFVITSGIGVFEQAHIKDLLALLRLTLDPHDRLAFDRLLCLFPSVGPRTAATLWQKLGGSFDCREPAQVKKLNELMRPSARDQWHRVADLMSAYHASESEARVVFLINDFLDHFYTAYLEKSYDDASERADDVREVANQITASSSVAMFLQEVALLTNTDQVEGTPGAPERDALRLSTIHQAKGLEWPHVFILWASEGMFPSSRALGEVDDDREERRLFYVATTRARDVLHICVPEWRHLHDGQAFACRPSRFVTEIPSDLLLARYGLRL